MPDSPLSPLKSAARAVGHLAAWASYHSGGRIEPRRYAARLTYYTSPADRS
jgi:hypothetical protein